MTLDRPWLIDPRHERSISRAVLLENLRFACRPVCRPADTADALQEITRALARGRELLLLDTDFSDEEIMALGLPRAEINRHLLDSDGPAVTWTEVERAAGGGSAARLGLFTSGSTGLPKLVWQTAANLTRAVRVSSRHAEAVWGLAYNPTHMAGIQVYLQALANGCPIVNLYGLGPADIWAAITRHAVTHLSATPSFFRLLLPASAPCQTMQLITLGGEAADPGLIGRLRAAFPQARLRNVYASTEAGTLLVADGDVFCIAEGLEDKVVIRDQRLHVHRSLLGEFSRTGSSPQKSVEVTTNEAWYDTGDVVEMVSTEPRRFRIVARERDWVNVGGSKVNPREVEAVLEEHPSVQMARVSGRKNSVVGSILVAEVVMREETGEKLIAEAEPPSQQKSDPPSLVFISQSRASMPQPTEAELRTWLAERLQPFKIPRLIRFVANIAQTRTGKTRRTDS